MLNARSPRRRLLVMAITVAGFLSAYEVTTFDSNRATEALVAAEVMPPAEPGSRLSFAATAYCKGAITKSGVPVQSGIAAADPSLLPVGSVVKVDSPDSRYNGIYTILDTGPAVQGKELDIYMWSCHEALKFGRKAVELTVLRFGWNPKASARWSSD